MTHTENARELRAQFDTKHKEHAALLAKGAEITAEDVQQAETLLGEMQDLRGRLSVSDSAARQQEAGTHLRQWADAPRGTSVPFPSSNGEGTPALPRGESFGTVRPGDPLTWGTGGPVHYASDLRDLPTPLPAVMPWGAPSPGLVLGMTAAGETYVEMAKGGIEVVQTGAGIMRKDQWEATRSDEYRLAFNRYLKGGWHGMTNGEQAILQEGVDTDGGYLAPAQIINQVVSKEPTPTRVAAMTSQFTTIRDKISLPKVVYSTDDLYTTGMRVTWTGEVPPSATAHRATQPVWGQVNIPVYTAMISLPVTNDLLEDSMIMLEQWLVSKFFETVELLRDNMVLNGTGTSQPSGILQNPGGTDEPATINSGSAAALTGDGLINLTESLPEQYDENAVLVFNKTNTGKAIRLLKDGDGRPLVSYGAGDFGLASGRYREVNGYPFAWSGFMPDVSANTYPIIFGDLRGYFLVTRVGFSVQVLRELYAETNQVLILGRVRFGGDVAEPWRIKIQKTAA